MSCVNSTGRVDAPSGKVSDRSAQESRSDNLIKEPPMAATKSPITRRRALAGTAGLAGSLAMNVGQAKDNEQPQSVL
jgi:hypothetical protein